MTVQIYPGDEGLASQNPYTGMLSVWVRSAPSQGGAGEGMLLSHRSQRGGV